jgi:post-segregation antitoxin (ccd killing protein)
MEKQVVSVKLDMDLYWQLKSEVGKGKISRFVENLISQELNKQDQKLAQEYQEAAKDKNR